MGPTQGPLVGSLLDNVVGGSPGALDFRCGILEISPCGGFSPWGGDIPSTRNGCSQGGFPPQKCLGGTLLRYTAYEGGEILQTTGVPGGFSLVSPGRNLLSGVTCWKTTSVSWPTNGGGVVSRAERNFLHGRGLPVVWGDKTYFRGEPALLEILRLIRVSITPGCF